MTASPGGGRGTARQPPTERITVALTPRASESLQQLQDRTGQG